MSGDRVIFNAFLALVFWLPIPLGSNRDWAWLAAACVVFLLAAFLLLQYLRRRISPSTSLRAARPAVILLAAWLLFGVLQWLPMPVSWVAWLSPGSVWPQAAEVFPGWATLSVDPYRSGLAWIQGVFLATVFILVLQLVNNRRRIGLLVGVIVLAGVLQAIYGGFMALTGVDWGVVAPKVYNRGLATGTFINRNHLAGFLVLCTALGIGYLLGQMRQDTTERDWRQRTRDWLKTLLGPRMRLRLCLVLMVIGLVLTHSRMGNASLFSALLISGGLGLLLLRRAPRAMLTLVISLLVIDILVIGTWFGVEQVVDRIQDTATWDSGQVRYRDQERLNIDNEILNAWPTFRWLGSGGGTFFTVYPSYRADDIGQYFDHAHNDYLELLLDYGAIGVLPLACFWLWCVAAAVNAQRNRRNPLMRGLGFGAGMASLAVAIHATVDFNLHIPSNAAYFVCILAMGVIAASMPTRRPLRTEREISDRPAAGSPGKMQGV